MLISTCIEDSHHNLHIVHLMEHQDDDMIHSIYLENKSE